MATWECRSLRTGFQNNRCGGQTSNLGTGLRGTQVRDKVTIAGMFLMYQIDSGSVGWEMIGPLLSSCQSPHCKSRFIGGRHPCLHSYIFGDFRRGLVLRKVLRRIVLYPLFLYSITLRPDRPHELGSISRYGTAR